MGEAKRRRDARLEAMAMGRPVPRPERCPACGSKCIGYVARGTVPEFVKGGRSTDVEYAVCGACSAAWEPFPALYVEDPVCAEPCDNCAFRPGSPEQADPERWKALLETLKPQGDALSQGRFYCHKHIPIDVKAGPGNFLFPQRPLTMDSEIVRKSDGEPVMVLDQSRMRTCSGYLRMLWAQLAKQEAAGG
jgi:hypothetical protein